MNLSTNVDFDIQRFFLWWGRELAAWLPEKIRHLLSDKSGYVFLLVTTETLQIVQLVNNEQQVMMEIALNDQMQERYRVFMADHVEFEKMHLVLRLSKSQAISKKLFLPLAVKDNLTQVIAYEMDKFTPFKEDQVYFAIKSVEKEQNGQIEVVLVLTPRETLDAIYLSLNDAKIFPYIVDYEGAENNFLDNNRPYNLLPEWERLVKNKVTQFSFWFLSIAALLLTVAVLYFPVWHEQQAVEILKKELKEVEKDAYFVQSQQREMDELVDETVRLIEIKNSVPTLTEIIDNLSQLIPEETWLTHLKYKDNRLQLQGQSPTASALIGVLEASPLLSNTRFVSPLTQDKRTGRERFQISVDLNTQGAAENE